jgi:peroxiredoxin Q/BCP
MKLKTGNTAPEISLPDQTGAIRNLSDHHGQWVLVYFYPKDDTPGCTKEACAIRDNFPLFKKLDCVVFGVSADTVKSHDKFAAKFELPFALLSDADKKVVNAYGVWQKKKFMGREYDGIVRTSFLINPEGRIEKIYENVKPETHAAEVLEDLNITRGR